MKIVKSCVMALTLALGISAAVSPAYAIYDGNGDLIYIVFLPDGTVYF